MTFDACWPLKALGSVCVINPRSSVGNRALDSTVSFVPMADLPEGQMGFSARQTKPLGSGGSYTYFEDDDVLLAKVSPCFENGKGGIARNLVNGAGLGSSELHVLRCGEAVLPEWIYFAVQHPRFRALGISEMTGSGGLRRLPREFVEAYEIPLPTVAEQRRIVARLCEKFTDLDRARKALADQLDAAEKLSAAITREAFERLISEKTPTAPLAEVSEITSGLTLGRKIRAKYRDVPYLRVANVKAGYLDLSDVRTTPATEDEIAATLLHDGDLLLTEGGDPDKLGRGTLWRGQLPECSLQNHVFRVRFDTARIDPDFAALQTGSFYGKAYFFANAKQTTGIASINKTILSAFPFLVPDLCCQKAISARCTKRMDDARRLAASLSDQLAALDRYPAALLREAFSGRL